MAIVLFTHLHQVQAQDNALRYGRQLNLSWAVKTAATQTKPADAGFKPLDFSLVRAGGRGFYSREFHSPGLKLTSMELPSSLPVPKTHPLPLTLAQWHDTTGSGDYFSSIKPTPVGYLVWWQFPIKIYVQRPTDPTESPSSLQRFQNWVDAVVKAVQEWNAYLPLEVVEQREDADISFLRSRPPIEATINRETGQFNIPRARAAQTRYKFYLRPAGDAAQQILAHRFTIQLSPDQTVDYTLATARHELGHALGIWGHSPQPTDTMYFSQVRRPPQISTRDINTLKQIYEQPTRVGWPLTAHWSLITGHWSLLTDH